MQKYLLKLTKPVIVFNQIQRILNIYGIDNLSIILEFYEKINILNGKFGVLFTDI